MAEASAGTAPAAAGDPATVLAHPATTTSTTAASPLNQIERMGSSRAGRSGAAVQLSRRPVERPDA
jgi:hypothetical protein